MNAIYVVVGSRTVWIDVRDAEREEGLTVHDVFHRHFGRFIPHCAVEIVNDGVSLTVRPGDYPSQKLRIRHRHARVSKLKHRVEGKVPAFKECSDFPLRHNPVRFCRGHYHHGDHR